MRAHARRAFTLIELLTVIAIIAILAALLFPTMAAVRSNMQKTSCISNQHAILQAMEMYKDDWRVYPEVLYGYAPAGAGGCVAIPNSAPAGQAPTDLPQLRLYPNYVKDQKVFTCPRSPLKQDLNQYRTPVFALNLVTGQPHARPLPGGVQEVYCYWPWDSYDFQYRPNPVTTNPADPNLARELHYTRSWSPGIWNSRQLVWREPPDSTVVTWCLYHSDMGNAPGNTAVHGIPARSSVALVAFKSGRVQTIPAEKLALWNDPLAYPWMVTPKP